MRDAKEREFIEGIRRAPEDDLLRYVYSDWLEEQGDKDRAAFMRAQLQLTSGTRFVTGKELTEEEWEALQRDENRLMAEHENEWTAPLAALGAWEVRFRRGVIDHVGMYARDFLDPEKGGKLLELYPIQSVAICNLDRSQVAALADSPHLGRLTHLNLYGNDIDAAGMAALADSPYLGCLNHLDLSFNDIGDAGAAILASSPHLRRLTHLNLCANNIGDPGAAVFAGLPQPGHLNNLDLCANHIGDAGAAALGSSPQLEQLTHLDLSLNTIGTDGATALADSPHLGRLTRLDLSYNHIGDEGAVALAGSAMLPKLKRLQLNDNLIQPESLVEVEQVMARRRQQGATHP